MLSQYLPIQYMYSTVLCIYSIQCVQNSFDLIGSGTVLYLGGARRCAHEARVQFVKIN